MFLGTITILLLAIFLGFYIKEPRRVINGLLFNLFFGSFSVFLIALVLSTGNSALMILVLIPIIIVLFGFSFGFVALMVAMFMNAKVLLKKEGRRFANCLTLFFGMFLLAIIILNMISLGQFLSDGFQTVYVGVNMVVVYLFFNAFNFLTAYFLYQFNRPKSNQDFIIVLGSGLVNDKVPPLLGSRIDKAIEFYWKQAKVTAPPTIILSGGQGPDENLPEAEAMQQYALEKGIPEEHTLREDKSTTTYENMLFSKRIMDSLKGEAYKSIFTTNNFHLFRAGLYAKEAGLNSQGIGSKTARYYWPNAMIREYIAVFVMNRKRHSIVIGIILGGTSALAGLLYLLS
ncbi:YdcF family protein [Priestia taiwanensis]|uniref:YdcF family protein n=1 Tax=Priestia taiwanensis TaxID=1347902 RepID=UPI00166D9E45|nr:YdcF family protein [Priestia taiwanensis]